MEGEAKMQQPICKTYHNGYKEWWLDGKIHRTDGPAREWVNGTKSWYLNGKIHRTDGPAVEGADGDKRWYLDGKAVSWQQVYRQAKEEHRLSILIAALTNP
jgi:hypothetical protein